MVKYAHEPDNATKAVKVRPHPDLEQSISVMETSCYADYSRRCNKLMQLMVKHRMI